VGHQGLASAIGCFLAEAEGGSAHTLKELIEASDELVLEQATGSELISGLADEELLEPLGEFLHRLEFLHLGGLRSDVGDGELGESFEGLVSPSEGHRLGVAVAIELGVHRQRLRVEASSKWIRELQTCLLGRDLALEGRRFKSCSKAGKVRVVVQEVKRGGLRHLPCRLFGTGGFLFDLEAS